MKNLAIAAVLGIVFIISCTPKTVPAASVKTHTAEYFAQGKTIYDNACQKCHDLPDPKDHSAQDWVGIMNSMAPKSHLTDEQHQMVYDYIVSAIK